MYHQLPRQRQEILSIFASNHVLGRQLEQDNSAPERTHEIDQLALKNGLKTSLAKLEVQLKLDVGKNPKSLLQVLAQ
jgi:hypothetical protein